MKIVKLTESVAVSEQITPENVAEIAAAGYKVLVNNRPDGEEANQPGNADIAAAAQAAGMEGPDFGRMRSLLDDTALPVLAFCRTGTRCTNLWVASRDDKSREQARAQARQLGYDLGMSTPRS